MANIFDEPVNPELFAGKTFYIAAGLFKEYEDKLISDIQVRRERVLRTLPQAIPFQNLTRAHRSWRVGPCRTRDGTHLGIRLYYPQPSIGT